MPFIPNYSMNGVVYSGRIEKKRTQKDRRIHTARINICTQAGGNGSVAKERKQNIRIQITHMLLHILRASEMDQHRDF